MSESTRYATYPSLRDRVVAITGGGAGIGAAMVEHFARQGSRVAFLDVNADASQRLVAVLSDEVAHVPLFMPCDLRDVTALQATLGEIARELGPVTVLVNNAANDDRHEFAGVTPEYWDERMAVNLRHQFFALQSVVDGMKAAGGGSIVNFSSIGWRIPSTRQVVYVTAKAAIVGLTRTMAHELGPANIRVNCVLPGAIMTERQKQLWMTPAYTAEVFAAQALKRDLVPADVARLVLFLAADDSSAITNASYVIDGGWV